MEMEHDEITAGARLRVLRKWRRLSQAQLAGMAGVSQGLISLMERGKRALDRRSHIADLASALRVSEVDLIGRPHLSTAPQQADPPTTVPALRTALATNVLGNAVVDRARPLDDLTRAVAECDLLRQRCDYVSLGAQLPSLIDELHLHAADPAGEADERRALAVLIDACGQSVPLAKTLGYADLAHVAVSRGIDAAQRLDEPTALGKAYFALSQTMAHSKESWGRALQVITAAADRLQPRIADDQPESIHALGMLTLSNALAAAAQLKTDDARAWLDEAHDLARRVPNDPDGNWSGFAAENVKIWRVAIGTELHEPARAMRDIALTVDHSKFHQRRSRRASLLLDVGRGLARNPKHARAAVQWFADAEQLAPQYVRNSVRVQEPVRVLLTRARKEAGGRQLRGMAARMGVPH